MSLKCEKWRVGPFCIRIQRGMGLYAPHACGTANSREWFCRVRRSDRNQLGINFTSSHLSREAAVERACEILLELDRNHLSYFNGKHGILTDGNDFHEVLVELRA